MVHSSKLAGCAAPGTQTVTDIVPISSATPERFIHLRVTGP